MKNKMLTAALLLLSFNVHAGLEWQDSSGTVLGTAKKAICSTGVTCTMNKYTSDLTIVSSPTLVAPLTLENGEIMNNTVDDTIEFLSDDNNTTLQITGFEAKTANLNLYADQGDDAADKFSINVSTADVLSFQNNASVLFSMDSSGNISGAGTNNMVGFLTKQVAATATTITAAQCGSSFYNTGAVVIALPDGTAALLGCRLTFFVANASNFDVNPGNSDQILTLTNAAGDAIRNATKGGSVTLQYGATNEWYVMNKEQGTWSDIN